MSVIESIEQKQDMKRSPRKIKGNLFSHDLHLDEIFLNYLKEKQNVRE